MMFYRITYMRTGTTISVYTTPWSLLTNSIHETMDYSICLCNTMVSTDRVVHGLMNRVGEKRPWGCIER
jgi:hypothetical protein